MPERELKVRLSADAQRFNTAMASAQRQFTGLKTAVAAGATAIAAGLAKSVQEAVEFEDSMAGVAKTVDASDATISRLGERFQEMSERIPRSANELANLGQVAGRLGVETENIEGFVETTAKLAEAVDGISGEQAAEELARFANVAGTSQDKFENLASGLVEMGNTSAATEGEILSFAQNLVSVGNQVGLTEGDVLGLSAAMVELGANGEAASTALQRAMLGMQDAVRRGGEELRTFATVSGMSVDQFRQLFEEDARQALIAFLQGIQRANEAGVSLSSVMEAVDLNTQRTIRALLKGAQASGTLEEKMAGANQAIAENVALQKEAERRFSTSAARTQMLANRMENLGQNIGEDLLPAFVATLEKANFLIGALDELADKAGEGEAALEGMAAISAGLDDAVQSTSLLTSEADALEQKIESLGEKLSGPARDQLFSALRPTVDKLRGGLIGVGEASTEVQQTFDRLERSNLNVSESSDEASVSLDQYRDQLSGLTGDGEAASDTVADLARKLDDATISTEGLSTASDSLLTNLARSGASLDRLEEIAEKMREFRESPLADLEKVEVPDAMEAINDAIERGEEEAEDQRQKFEDIVRELDRGARGAIDMARAVGLIGDNAAATLNSVANLGTNISDLAGLASSKGGLGNLFSSLSGIASAAGPIGGIAAAAGSILGGIFGGGGPSPEEREEQRRREQLARLRTDLETTLALLESNGDRLQEIASSMDADLLSSLERLFASFDGAPPAFQQFTRRMEEMGIGLSDLQDVARQFGLQVDELIQVLATGEGDTAVAREQMEAFHDALGLLPDAIDRARRSIRDLMGDLNQEFERFDIEEPIRRIQRMFSELFDAFAVAPETPEIRRQIEETRQQLASIRERRASLQEQLESATGFREDILEGMLAQVEQQITTSEQRLQNLQQQLQDAVGPEGGPLFQLLNQLQNFDLSQSSARSSAIDQINEFITRAFDVPGDESTISLPGVPEGQRDSLKNTLIQMIDLIRDIEEGATSGAGEGTTVGGGTPTGGGAGGGTTTARPSFVQRATISDVQADEMIAIQRTRLVHAEMQTDLQRMIVRVLADLPSNIRDGVDIALGDELEQVGA